MSGELSVEMRGQLLEERATKCTLQGCNLRFAQPRAAPTEAHKTLTPSQAELDPRGRCCGMPTELRGVAAVPLDRWHPASPFPLAVLFAERVSEAIGSG